MGFKVIVSKKAQNEIENAAAYYAEINLNLAFRFYSELIETYKKLELNPNYQIRLCM
jgi:toxin ParE1/3/4